MLALALERAYLAVRARRSAASASVSAVPVVVIGNLVAGGSGKTPALMAIARTLQAEGRRVGIISRGYGAAVSVTTPRRVSGASDPRQCGDEPVLLAARLGCPVWVARDRVAALHAMLAAEAVDVVLSDDGLQHTALPRALEICMVDGTRGFGNGHCLPAGPLREPAERLARVDFVLARGASLTSLARIDGVMRLRAAGWRSVADDQPLPLAALPPGTRVCACAGIAGPAQFFAMLRGLGLEVAERAFADHHRFTARDFRGARGRVVMTEKDAVKCRRVAPPGALALAIEAELPAALLALLRSRLAPPC
jgi:tetraacyldisaccharide 4'-kinase